MKVTGRIKNASVGMFSQKPELTLELDDKNALTAEYDMLKDKDKLTIEVKPYRAKRSNSANAYAWVLMDKIAESQGITKEEVYLHQIQKVGVFQPISINEAAVDTMIHSWSLHGLGWIAQRIGKADKNGFVEMAFYYGSSSYNTKQMTRLIDNIVQECKILGIDTKTPDEIANICLVFGKGRLYMAKSIIQEDKDSCYLCGMNRNLEPLDKHHVYGASNRKHSEKYGLTVYLHHRKCHIFGENSAHVNAEVREQLQAEVQKKAMKHYNWSIEDFRSIFGRNYL